MPVFKLLRFYDERLRDIGMGFPRRRWILYYIISMLAPVGLAVSGWIRSTPAITVAGVVVGVGIWAWFYSQAQTARRLRFEQEAFLNSGHVAACIQEEQARILQDWLHKERWLSVAAVAHLSSGVDQELAEHRRRHLAGWKHVPLFLGIFLAGLSGAIYARVPEAQFSRAVAEIGRLLAQVASVSCLVVTALDVMDFRGYKLLALRRMLTDVALDLLRASSPAGSVAEVEARLS